jgi:acyl-CoA reductase-like NAD-dependent aldehyde dehydrogenase
MAGPGPGHATSGEVEEAVVNDAMIPDVRTTGMPFVTGKMLIAGSLVEGDSGAWLDCINPANEERIGRVPLGTAADVDRAVEAAQRARKAWAALPVPKRAAHLIRLADALSARADDLLTLEVADTGNTITGMAGDISSCIERLRYYAGLGYELQGATIPSSADRLNITLREPYGVVGRIVAFNHPAAMAIQGVAAPLMAGNTMVVKPSELTSLSATLFAEIAKDVLPAGVLNIVTGGREVGDALVRHPRVKRLSFVGSVGTGMAIQRSAAEVAVKAISLELGGKNPFIAFPDAPVDEVAAAAVSAMNFTWQGQSCNSTSRLFLHDSIHDAVLQRVVERVKAIRLGDPSLRSTEMGAMVSRAQLERTESYVRIAVEEGARLVAGGRRPEGPGFERGYWFEPTVFAGVRQDMRIAREEVFGPVLSVLRWSEEEEVVAMANSLDYGLTGVVWSRDISQALRVAKNLESGYIWVNGATANAKVLPFGGYKNSGIGRERGLQELHSYTESKSVQIYL